MAASSEKQCPLSQSPIPIGDLNALMAHMRSRCAETQQLKLVT